MEANVVAQNGQIKKRKKRKHKQKQCVRYFFFFFVFLSCHNETTTILPTPPLKVALYEYRYVLLTMVGIGVLLGLVIASYTFHTGMLHLQVRSLFVSLACGCQSCERYLETSPPNWQSYFPLLVSPNRLSKKCWFFLTFLELLTVAVAIPLTLHLFHCIQ
jgi:hypothetical protein